MLFLFLECCEIVSKILENFTNPAMDIKAGPFTEGRESRFQPAESSNTRLKDWSQDFYLQDSKRDNR